MLNFWPFKRRSESAISHWSWLMPWGGRKTLAGPSVDPELALTLGAVWCATRVISETVAMLPLFVYRKTDDGGREQATDHRLYPLLKTSPNADMGSMAFREGRTAHQVNWGNAFAEIERTFGGEVASLWPIHPSRVKPYDEDGYAYRVRNKDGTWTPFKRDELLHIPGTLSDDGIWGKGVIDYARESIGGALATEQHGAKFFGGGAQPQGILVAPGMKDPEARKNLRQEWKEVHSPAHGGESGEIAIFPPDTSYTPITISNENSQFLESRKQNVNEIARWYRVPPHMIGDLERATFSNIEHSGIEFVIYTLLPWLRRWEDELTRKLLTIEEQQTLFIEHQVSGLLRGDIASRMTAYKTSLESGIMTINEVRRLENLSSIGAAGDQNFVPLNMTTAERMLAGPPEPVAKELPTAASAKFADVARGVLSDSLSRLFVKEAKAFERKAAKETDIAPWLAEFHAKHVVLLQEALAAAMPALIEAGVETDGKTLAAGIVERSRVQLLAAFETTQAKMKATLDGWDASRTAEELAILFPERGAKHAA